MTNEDLFEREDVEFDTVDDSESADDFDDDFDEYDDLEDASADDVDFIVALYREDGSPVVLELPYELANDLDGLIDQLRRMPGDAGATAVVSICQEFFVLCRVRGRKIQVLLSDSASANDWPLAHDVAEFLDVDIPEDEEDSETIGDFDMLVDQGISEFDMETIAGNLDQDPDENAVDIIEKMRFGNAFAKVVDWER